MEREQRSWCHRKERKMKGSEARLTSCGWELRDSQPYPDAAAGKRHSKDSCYSVAFIFRALLSEFHENPWGIMFPETASLFTNCFKWIAQLRHDKNEARGLHVSSLTDRRVTGCSQSWGPDGIPKASWSWSSSVSPWGEWRTYSLPNVLPLLFFWLVLSPGHTSELMTVLGWCCPDPLRPTVCSILLAAGETGAGLTYKKKCLLPQYPITSTYSPWEVSHSWDPPSSPGIGLSLWLMSEWSWLN